MAHDDYDFDWLVVGSGFGGSVAALRLAEKGYRVGVLESGRRFADDDFARSTRDVRRYFWAPFAGLRGILRITLFKDVFVVSGAGVGGGSLVYGNTLYRARDAFYDDPHWASLADWRGELAPHYETAERMLGVSTYDREGPADALLREYAEELGVADTYEPTRVGVFFGEPGVTVPDPYFGGEGPERTGCVRCGACIVGCRYGAKNTLVKNYLWFAERLGARVLADRTVTDVRPLGAADGSDGYAVTSVRAGAILRRDSATLTARGVVLAAGALGTNRLLLRCRAAGSLPRVSDRLGELVRTNSESIVAITGVDDSRNFAESVAITSSMYPDPDTHIEVCTYGRNANSQGRLFAHLTTRGGRLTRPLFFVIGLLRNPRAAVRLVSTRRWSSRTVLLLVMETRDTAIKLRVKRRLPGGSVALTTDQDPDKPKPGLVPSAYEAAEWFAARMPGIAQASATEAVFAIPSTGHLLGGAVIGASPHTGVVDSGHRVFGYENLLVCDGSAVTANVGANPSLTITALAERALSQVPPAAEAPATASLGAGV